MTRAIRISEPAAEELSEAVRWYEARRGGLGGEFFDAVVTTLGLIASHPEIGARELSAARTRRVLVSRFPYQVVYRLSESELVVVAVAHSKRRPGYWKHRR